MLKETVEKALNDQIQRELSSAYLYLSMSTYFEYENLPGFAHWMRLQAQEELGHAMRMFNHVQDRGGRVILQAVEQPQTDFKSPLAVFELTLGHERKVTGFIESLYALAAKENDYATQTHLQWFIDEQVEEEKTADGILSYLKGIADDQPALYILDKELGSRALGATTEG